MIGFNEDDWEMKMATYDPKGDYYIKHRDFNFIRFNANTVKDGWMLEFLNIENKNIKVLIKKPNSECIENVFEELMQNNEFKEAIFNNLFGRYWW